MAAYFLGIDIGTQGARVVLVDEQGQPVASSENVFPLNDDSRQEQSPAGWWDACLNSLKTLVADVKEKINIHDIKAVAVTSTSGTVIPLDADNQPLHNAIMYSDKRSAAQGKKCEEAALKYHPHGFTAFNSSCGLSKMVWFVEEHPEQAKKIAKLIHAADFVTGKLSGRFDITDYTNAFKSGYDVSNYNWPAYLYAHLPLKKEWLQDVVPSGTIIGTLNADVAAATGLPADIKVSVGITDGCASQIASGAMNPGDWNTTIGTTLVIKGVTKNEVIDPLGRIYSHRHPLGYWMPGGASNTGADWVTNEFTENLKELNEQAEKLLPTGYISYPLRQQGERFPFMAPQARGFEPDGLSTAERFTANMEGVAYMERFAFELIESLSGEQVNAVFTAGGGSNSDAWLTIRANVLNVPVHKMKYVSGAIGAAVLAASTTHYPSIIEAARAMTKVDKTVKPEKELAEKYEANYQKFVQTMLDKGYIQKEETHA